MTLAGDLTIVLTLKDRAAFTLRWMSYANAIALPFKVLIADGGADESVPAMLADKTRFPNVAYEYVRYPYDATYSDYYAKACDALNRVGTPYVVLADNDDFFVVAGLRRALEFLSANDDYVACGGQCAAFWLGPRGGKIEWKFRQNPHTLSAPSALERIRRQSLDSDHIFYHVMRTAELRRQFAKVKEFDPHDLFLLPQLISYLSAITGRIGKLDTLYIARQWNTPGSIAGSHQEKYGDWWGRMLLPTWSDDFRKFVEITAAELAAADGLPMEQARDSIVKAYRTAIAPSLLFDVLGEQTVTPAMLVALPLVRKLVGLPEESLLRRCIRWWYRNSRWLSFDAVFGMEFVAHPAANARQDFEPIREFLERDQSSTRTSGT